MTPGTPPPRILSIAGSDSSGGAGIQADIKTVTMLGGYAMTAITAVTAQNTRGVQAVETLPAAFVLQQIASCVEDIGVDAIKIGMLGSADIVCHVAAALVAAPEIAARSASGQLRKGAPPGATRLPIVVDPVMVATSGDLLASDETIAAMKARLFPLATVLTPNMPELEVLAGCNIRTLGDMREAATALAAEFDTAIVAKGGHGEGETVTDLLVQPDGATLVFEHPKLATRHTHGSGCTLASALATLLAHGQPLDNALKIARSFVYKAIEQAPGFGLGSGPMRHNFKS